MSKTGTKKTNWVAIVLLLIILAGGMFGAYHFTNGFKDNPFKKPETDSSVTSGKELVSTTYITEKYGTFEVPVNHIIKKLKRFWPIHIFVFPERDKFSSIV